MTSRPTPPPPRRRNPLDTRTWRKLSHAILNRDHHVCQIQGPHCLPTLQRPRRRPHHPNPPRPLQPTHPKPMTHALAFLLGAALALAVSYLTSRQTRQQRTPQRREQITDLTQRLTEARRP
jgi:hypothetical protein